MGKEVLTRWRLIDGIEGGIDGGGNRWGHPSFTWLTRVG